MSSEFENAYGIEFSRLQCWQNLCTELQVDVFDSIRKCKMVVLILESLELNKLLTSMVLRLSRKFMSTWSICWTVVLMELLSKSSKH